MPESEEIGLWFTTNPTAVISTYLTDDPTPVPMDHAELQNPEKWSEYAEKIGFCVVTVSNHKRNPKEATQNAVTDVIKELQAAGVRVYIAVTCLLGDPKGGPRDVMVDGENIRSRNWFRPTDDRVVSDIVDKVTHYCAELDPSGVLLWYATFPNENYCYKSNCVDEATNELDLDERASVLAQFLRNVTDEIRADHPTVDIAIETDVQGAANIKYRYGVDLAKLSGIVDEIFLHVMDQRDETIKRAAQIASSARKHDITPKFYVSLLYKTNFGKIHGDLTDQFPTNLSLLVYSPRRETAEHAIDAYLTEKWEPYVNRSLLAGSGASVLLAVAELFFGLTLPFGPYGVPGSILLGAVLFVLSYREERLPVISQTLAHHVAKRPW